MKGVAVHVTAATTLRTANRVRQVVKSMVVGRSTCYADPGEGPTQLMPGGGVDPHLKCFGSMTTMIMGQQSLRPRPCSAWIVVNVPCACIIRIKKVWRMIKATLRSTLAILHVCDEPSVSPLAMRCRENEANSRQSRALVRMPVQVLENPAWIPEQPY